MKINKTTNNSKGKKNPLLIRLLKRKGKDLKKNKSREEIKLKRGKQ